MVGLRNQGATCYLNSLLQSLYFTNAFRKVRQTPLGLRMYDKLTGLGCLSDTHREGDRSPKQQRLGLAEVIL